MMFVWRCPVFVVLLACMSMSSLAMDIPKGVKVLTAPEVRDMLKSPDRLLVNALSRIEYQMQHIPGSINIPVDEVKSSSQMPTDKSAAIIFYCNGVACPYSRRAAKTAVKLGYTRVYWFKGGILEWRQYQYPMEVDKELARIKVSRFSPERFIEQMSEPNVLVLDVRPQWWRSSKEQAGVIEGTEMMLPLIKLHLQYERLPKDRPILLVDRLMRQSPLAAKFLTLKGYQVLGVLKGGAKRWVAEGRAVLAGKDEPVMLVEMK